MRDDDSKEGLLGVSSYKIRALEVEVTKKEKSLEELRGRLKRSRRGLELSQGLKYYVYFCLVDGNIAYVGKGTGDRWKHTVSGRSSCRELNKDIFDGKTLTVFRTRDDMTEEEACRIGEEKMKAEKLSQAKIEKEENIKRLEAKLQRLKGEII